MIGGDPPGRKALAEAHSIPVAKRPRAHSLLFMRITGAIPAQHCRAGPSVCKEVNVTELFQNLQMERMRDVTSWLPVQSKPQLQKFYVRDCYEEYYGKITDLLQELQYISLTGTPGNAFLSHFLVAHEFYFKESASPFFTITLSPASEKKTPRSRLCLLVSQKSTN